MAAPYSASMPPGLEVTDGYTIRLAALNPTTGAVVAGVKVSALTIQVVAIAGSSIGDVPGFTVTPLLQYTPGLA